MLQNYCRGAVEQGSESSSEDKEEEKYYVNGLGEMCEGGERQKARKGKDRLNR